MFVQSLVLGLLLALASYAEISINPMQLDFLSHESTRKDIKVTNHGQETAYVQVESYVVMNPGEKSEKKVLKKRPGELGLLVTPRKMAIEPGKTQFLRINNLKKYSGKERVYRLIIKPISDGLVAGRQKKKVAANVNILIGYSALVIVRPKTLHPNMAFTQISRKLKAVNLGNTSILLASGEVCFTEVGHTERTCSPLPARRLYVGNTWEWELEKQGLVSYSKILPGSIEPIQPETVAKKTPGKQHAHSKG